MWLFRPSSPIRPELEEVVPNNAGTTMPLSAPVRPVEKSQPPIAMSSQRSPSPPVQVMDRLMRGISFKSGSIGTSFRGGSNRTRTRAIFTLTQASDFIDLLPTANCIINKFGVIQGCNRRFETRLGSAKNMSSLFAEAGDKAKFESMIRDLEILGGNELQEVSEEIKTNVLTKGDDENESASADYQWTIGNGLGVDSGYFLVTGIPLFNDRLQKKLDERMKEFTRRTNKFLAIKESEMKMQAMAETLEIKRIFVRYVSHEIRTPLNIVMSGMELLKASAEGNMEAIEIIADVKSACASSIDILNDLLTYEKMDSNILVVDKAPCDVIDVVKTTFDMFFIQAKHSDISLLVKNKIQDKFIIVDADATKISQVFRNLISNALKFTPFGGTVSIVLQLSEDRGRFRLEVHDSGPGISKEDRKKLFNEIVQFNPKALQNGQGSGLGLYLSRHIVDVHGGRIGVDLEWDGVGSIFFVELPLAAEQKAIAPRVRRGSTHMRASSTFEVLTLPMKQLIEATDEPLGRDCQLLIVDDAVLCRKFHRRILKPFCSRFQEATNGEEAVSIVEQALSGLLPSRIDGIIMDSSMPIMDGLEASKRIRELGYKGKIFGVTGNAFQADIDDFLAHGVTEVLVKPLSIENYNYILDEVRKDILSRTQSS